MPPKNILFLNGIADNGKVNVTAVTKNNGMHFQLNGNANIADFIDTDLITPFNIVFDLDHKQDLKSQPAIQAIFNQISDADTHKITLAKTEALYNIFSEKLPFFNAPANIKKTNRDNIYQLLQGIDKLHVPKTVRLQPKSPSDIYEVIKKEGFEYPVIFRQAGDHGGISTIKIDDTTEQFNAFALDGRDYYLTQFVDYQEKGLYEKIRLMVIDGKVFTRGTMICDQWLVHAKNELFDANAMTMRRESLKSFEKEVKPKIEATINEIHERLGLDYFGIDCHIDDNKNILIFEVNASMSVLTTSEKKKKLLDPYIKKINHAISKMIKDRIESSHKPPEK